MKRKIRLFSVALAAGLLLSGCISDIAPNAEKVVHNTLEGKPVLVGNVPGTFPLTDDEASLNVMAVEYGDTDYEDVYVWKQYENMTGVDIRWTNVNKSERAEAVNAALLNGQALDLIIRCKVSASRLIKYGEKGLILDLAKDDLLKKFAPNCWAYLQSHPDALASVTNPDGSIYSLPQVNSGAELRVGMKLFVNKVWLENVAMGVPKTTEELYLLLKTFKEKDANKNGDAGDEIPFCCANWQSVQESLFGAFGLGNRGLHNHTVDCDEATGKVRLITAADGYRDYLTYLNRLYEEELLDRRIFSISEEQWRSNAANDEIGVFASTNLAWIPADKADNWVAVDEALEGPNGDKFWSAIRANFHSTGAAVLPATCKNPELVLRWLDYFWTDEGTLFYHMGVEGETFIETEDGGYDYMPYIYDKMKTENESFDDVVAYYSPYPGGGNPTVEIAPYFMGGEMADVPADAARKLFKYGPTEYWPSFTFTAAENEALDAIRTDIEKYYTAMRVEFVAGTKPLSQWDDYVEQLERLKMNELLNIYQAAVDRYYAMQTTQN